MRKSVKGELSTCKHGRTHVTCGLLYRSTLLMVFGLILWKWMNGMEYTDSNQECKIGYKNFTSWVSQCLAYTRKLGHRKSSEGLRSFKPSKETNLITLLILAGDIEMKPGPRFQAPRYFYTDRSKAVLLLWFLTVTCSSCLYLYFGSAIMLVTYFVNFR